MAMGRPTKYNEEIDQAAIEYVNGGYTAVPTMAGLSRHLKVGIRTLYDWADKDIGNFSQTLEDLQTEQEAKLVERGLTGVHNSTITKLMLANHGYAERQELSHGLSDELASALNSAANSGGLPIAE